MAELPRHELPPDHPFQRSGPDFCDHVVYVHQETGWPVLCGLRKNQHPVQRLTIPEPKDGP